MSTNTKKKVGMKNEKTEKLDDSDKLVPNEDTHDKDTFDNDDDLKNNVDDVDSHFKTLLVGYAPKLSTKTTGRIGYEVALNDDDKCRYLRLTSNDTGGLFSKEWIKLDDLYELLESMDIDKPFKSSVFKSLISGSSSNNQGFLSAVLRCNEISLILKSTKSQYLHVVNPLLINQRDRLSKLKPMKTSSKK